MPNFMAPLVDWLLGVLKDMDFGELDPFLEYKQSWTGVIMNWPSVSVMPSKSQFDPEITGVSHSENLLTVKFGVQGGNDPDQLTADAMAYMKAIDAAIEAAPLPPGAGRVFVIAHDFGPVWVKDGSVVRFPELHLLVEVYEQ